MRGRLRAAVMALATAVAAPVAAPSAATAADGAVVLIYHRFGETRYPTTSVGLDQFERQLAAIESGGYTVVPLPELVAALQSGAPIAPRTVAITIDDAYRSAYREAWPRLSARGFPFTLFVSTDAADGGAGDLMNWDQIREMAAAGVTIGHHGAAHAHMADMTVEQATIDLARADARFEAELGAVPALFAYPYGEYGAPLRDLIAVRGFTAAFGQQSGVTDRWSDPFGLPRFPINATTSFDAFALRLAALPLPATDVAPRDPVVTADANPPAVSFRLVAPEDEGGPLRTDALTCYFNGGSVSAPIDGDVVRPRITGTLGSGRSRLNCTMPAAGGRWRWHGMQFYVP